MANVYTRKSKFPRTITLRDFASVYQGDFHKPRNPRCLSPTRRQNPHPSGLAYQDPYNKDDAVSQYSLLFLFICAFHDFAIEHINLVLATPLTSCVKTSP